MNISVIGKSLSVILLISSISFLFIIPGIPLPSFGKILISAVALVVMFIAWINEPVGGSLFVILGALFLLLLMGAVLPTASWLFVSGYFGVGAVFIIGHLYNEKKEMETAGDF